MTPKRPYKISFALAVIPMIAGVLIFLIWWAARAFFAEDIYYIETVGYNWAMVSLVLLALSLIIITISVFKKQNPGKWKRFFIVLGLIAFNFLILDVVIRKADDIQQYAFTKITNETGQDLKINFYTYLKTEKAHQLKHGKSKVISYIPESIMKPERDYAIEPLIFEANETIFKLENIDRNDCRKFVLNKHFEMTLLNKK